MAVVPAALALASVWLISPSDPADDVGVLRKFVDGQKIPAATVFFMVFAMVVWRFRYSLPLSFAIGPGRRDLPQKLWGRFEEAGILLGESRRILRTKKRDVDKELTTTEKERVVLSLDELERTMVDTPFQAAAFESAIGRADRAVGEHLSRWRKSEIREYAEAILIALAIAATVRLVLFEPFKIPTGSMIPTLMVGDYIFVNKSSYGPEIPFTDKRVFDGLPPDRGDVMVFWHAENAENYIKRVIALPGDVLEVVDGRPILNGWLVPHCYVGTFDAGRSSEGPHELYVEFLHDQAYFTQFNGLTADREGEREGAKGCRTAGDCNTGLGCYAHVCANRRYEGPFHVDPREVWVLGDNRDNSHDSRAWRGGLGAGVPFDEIKGRAMFVFATFGAEGSSFADRFLVNVMGRPTLPSSETALRAPLERCLRQMPKETDPPAPPPK